MAKKEQLFEDMKSRFQEICKYDTRMGLNETTILNNLTDEADEQEAPADPSMGDGAAPADGGAPMGGDPNAMGGDPSMGGAPMGGDPNAMGGDPSMGGAPMGDGAPAPADGGQAAPPEGFNPQDASMGGDPNAMGADPTMDGGEQSDDEVVDITELTDAQDDMAKDIEHVNDKFDKIFKALGQFEELLRSNDEKIDNLAAEYERRNPTQVEKLSMQTAKSYPFNVTPEEFWKEKEATSNYSVEDDNNGKDQGQYVITANDVNGDTNWKGISDSLDDDDFMFGQTLSKMLGLK